MSRRNHLMTEYATFRCLRKPSGLSDNLECKILRSLANTMLAEIIQNSTDHQIDRFFTLNQQHSETPLIHFESLDRYRRG